MTIPQESNAYKLKIKGFEFFKCNGNFGLNQGSSLELEAQIIEILGNFTLSEQLGSTQNPLKIKTKYLDVIGNTIIKKAVLLIEGNSASAIRFNGGYDQMNSDIKINGADQVIFGGTVSFTHDDRWDTSVTARKIYFDSSNPIKFQQGGTFQYTGLNSDLISINFGSDVQSWFWATLSGDLISEGNYKSIVTSDIIPDNLEFQGGYTSPSWSNYPSSLLNEPTEPNVDFVWKEQQGKPGTEIYH